MFWKKRPQPQSQSERLTSEQYQARMEQALASDQPAQVLAELLQDRYLIEVWLPRRVLDRAQYAAWAEGLIRLGNQDCGRLGEVAVMVGRELAQAESPAVGEGVPAPETPSSQSEAVIPTSDNQAQAEAWFEQGCDLFSAGDFVSALASYDQALHYQPDNYQAWINRGIVLCDHLGQFQEAMACFDQALHYQPDNHAVNHAVWYNRGICLGNLGRDEEAIASYDQALHYQPDFHPAWHNRGICLQKLGRDEEAISSYDQALHYRPDFHPAWHSRGDSLGKLGRYEEGIASYNQALHYKSNNPGAWYNRGVYLYYLEYGEEAIWSFDQALQYAPKHYQVWSNRGVCLANLGCYEEAIASFDQALHSQPDDPKAWNNRGLSLSRLGRDEEAIASYDQALHYQPDFHQAWVHRGNTAEASRGYEAAAASTVRWQQLFTAYRPYLLTSFQQPSVSLQQLIQQPISPALLTALQAHASYAATLPPALHQRGWDGLLASYQAGLEHCPADTHPLGHGYIQTALGNAYYRAQKVESPRSLWRQAVVAYDRAVACLTEFPQEQLQALQRLMRPLLALGERERATACRIQGVALLNQLINAAASPTQKRQIEAQFHLFAQVQVDSLVADQEIILALETAERTKNRCLTWILDEWQEQVLSPRYAEMQTLLTPTTAIIYWHLSPDALTTFILTADRAEPQVLEGDRRHAAQALETWLQTWDRQYSTHPWRTTLATQLATLQQILQIDAICQHLPTPIDNLILIPHRDLHRLPLHTLFRDFEADDFQSRDPYPCTFLPSLQIGLNLLSSPSPSSSSHPTSPTPPPLPIPPSLPPPPPQHRRSPHRSKPDALRPTGIGPHPAFTPIHPHRCHHPPLQGRRHPLTGADRSAPAPRQPPLHRTCRLLCPPARSLRPCPHPGSLQ